MMGETARNNGAESAAPSAPQNRQLRLPGGGGMSARARAQAHDETSAAVAPEAGRAHEQWLGGCVAERHRVALMIDDCGRCSGSIQ